MTRKITDEEKKLWKLATKGIRGKGARVEDFIAETGKIKITPAAEMILKRPAKKKAAAELLAGKINQMDAGSFTRLKNGKIKIEARIDLHGMWLNQAQFAVRDFIMMSAAAGRRCVLVITGKGGITGGGKIRAELPKWLNDIDLRGLILSFTPAHKEHGGDGAFYVYLRK